MFFFMASWLVLIKILICNNCYALFVKLFLQVLNFQRHCKLQFTLCIELLFFLIIYHWFPAVQ